MSIFLSFKLRRVSNTNKFERKKNKLQSDYEKYQAFLKSGKVEKYRDLEAVVLSNTFQENKKEIESKSYKNSPLYHEEKELQKLQKSKKIKTYFKVKNSSDLEHFNKIKETSELKEFLEIKKKIDAETLTKKSNPEEWRKYKKFKKNRDFKRYIKFSKSKAFHIYNEITDNDILKRLNDLTEKVNSKEFRKEKAFLLDKKRYNKTEDYKKLKEFETFRKSEEFKTFLHVQKKNPFKELEQWELTFSDEFNSNKLDTDKWITNYYWGNKLLGNNYSHTDDFNAFTNCNIKIDNSVLKLKAKKEQQKSVVWDYKRGFVPKQFSYTSGIISSGKSFRQKYGKFEAKIKITNAKQLQNAFWLLSEKSTPHVDIFNTEKGKLLAGNYWKDEKQFNKQNFRIKGIRPSKGYFIYTLEWSANKMIWKINDVVVKTILKGIPKEPMFLNFALLVKHPKSPVGEMSIDWVRCYQQKRIE